MGQLLAQLAQQQAEQQAGGGSAKGLCATLSYSTDGETQSDNISAAEAQALAAAGTITASTLIYSDNLEFPFDGWTDWSECCQCFESLEAFLGPWFPALSVDLHEFGVETTEDMTHLDSEHIAVLASKLKPAQAGKFNKKLAELCGSGDDEKSTAAEPEPEPEFLFENIARCTNAEMRSTCNQLRLHEVSQAEQLVYHYTDIASAKLITGVNSIGFRASFVGQGGGGVCT